MYTAVKQMLLLASQPAIPKQCNVTSSKAANVLASAVAIPDARCRQCRENFNLPIIYKTTAATATTATLCSAPPIRNPRCNTENTDTFNTLSQAPWSTPPSDVSTDHAQFAGGSMLGGQKALNQIQGKWTSPHAAKTCSSAGTKFGAVFHAVRTSTSACDGPIHTTTVRTHHPLQSTATDDNMRASVHACMWPRIPAACASVPPHAIQHNQPPARHCATQHSDEPG